MIIEPTVLILGAGASADYGFPTGRKLLLDICKNANPGGELRNFLNGRWGIDTLDIQQFVEALRGSMSSSVDYFLEHRNDYEHIGNLAIAASLIPYQNPEALVHQEQPRWYEKLFQLMADGGDFGNNQLSVVTFNYDRSLEAFIFTALQNLYGPRYIDKAEDQFNKIKIVHLYGSLGAGLVGFAKERGYRPGFRTDWVEDAAQRIKILHEAEPNTPEFEQAHHLLKGATEIIFSGSAFIRGMWRDSSWRRT